MDSMDIYNKYYKSQVLSEKKRAKASEEKREGFGSSSSREKNNIASSSSAFKAFGNDQHPNNVDYDILYENYWSAFKNPTSDMRHEKEELKACLERMEVLNEKLEKTLSGENRPEPEKPPMKKPKSVQSVLQEKFYNYQSVLVTYTLGDWKVSENNKIAWLEDLRHFNPKMVALKNATCDCQKQKEKEEQKTKIINLIETNIANLQSFAVIFDENKTAWIYALNSSDVNWIQYTIEDKEFGFSLAKKRQRIESVFMVIVFWLFMLLAVLTK